MSLKVSKILNYYKCQIKYDEYIWAYKTKQKREKIMFI